MPSARPAPSFAPAPHAAPTRPAPTASQSLPASRTEPAPTAKPARTITPPQTARGEGSGTKTPRTPGDALWTTLGGLLAIVVAIVGLARLWRKHAPASFGGLPSEALEVLGRRPLEPRTNLHLVRVGSRILLLGSSPDGLRTLSEIVDPVEVDFVAGLCRKPGGDRTLVDGVGQFLARLRAATPAATSAAAASFAPPPVSAGNERRAAPEPSAPTTARAPRTPLAAAEPFAAPDPSTAPLRRTASLAGSTRLRDIEIELRRAAGEVVAPEETTSASRDEAATAGLDHEIGALTPEQRLAERFVRRREPGATPALGTGRDRG